MAEFLDYSARFLNTTGDEDDEPICCTYIGVTIYTLGAFCMALGVNLQKYSINKEIAKYPDEKEQRRGLWCQPIWVAGILTYASSGGLLSAALLFASQSQLAPLMSVVIVSNAILARILLNEPISKRDLTAICIIIIAVIMTTLSAPQSTEKYTSEELIALYKEPGFGIFIAILISCLLLFFISNRFVLAKVAENPPRTSRMLMECTKADPNYVPKYQENLFAFSYGGQAGLWGGLCVTMMKSALSVIVDESEQGGIAGIFTNGLTYGLLAVLIACWTLQLYWINAGLERYPAVFVVSIEAVLNELIAVSGGVLYFQEYTQFTPKATSFFVLGLAAGVGGIFLFATRNNFETEDVFEDCCARKVIKDDPNKLVRPVEPGSRRPSWKRDSANDLSRMVHNAMIEKGMTPGAGDYLKP
mmetsp:Transcript_12826/g.14724  ORF Transcript_12826/g.14724 Transcript_12826/m.14724 type:complete len:416 (-) Transcript_12826:99-1346(-)|eukprot:CAMPEP_0184019632 /NCGR_PEP_ID=MMETSP0954-20121128/8864_1 /TAXON_ID=627963 /ORGANISM="Aplanochytrium sp, Strain PBS07" /LENGTH=415 /DNA_ID=CAMNT_0026301329 /DNA_START=147 /DNA_END=1394 /DNA_ORIENTATION=-